MRLTPPSNIELRKIFGRVLNDILDGTITFAPEGNGLDEQTNAALNDLAAHMDERAQYTLTAYEVFAAQLNGQHAAEAQDELLKLLGL